MAPKKRKLSKTAKPASKRKKEKVNEYEALRGRNIQENNKKLSELGISQLASSIKPPKSTAPKAAKAKKRNSKIITAPQPTRRSSRKRKEVNYREPGDSVQPAENSAESSPTPIFKFKYEPGAPTSTVKPSYDLSEGRRSKNGHLLFPDHKEFTPNLTPQQVIRSGSFGGVYFHPKGGKPGMSGKHSAKGIDIKHKEFPDEWFKGLPLSIYHSRRYRKETNKYGVKAGQGQAEWERSGWIHPRDPRGWFHWYCRFFTGRRSDDDARQISRWMGVAGPKGRWKKTLVNQCVRKNKAWNDQTVSPVIRQTLLHWAYELTEADFYKLKS